MAKLKVSTPKDARSLAVYVLQQMDKATPLQSALDSALVQFPIKDNEKSLCTELVYGYTRYAIRIDAILDNLLKKRQDLPKLLQLTLGISVYSLLFLSKVPSYASVNWAVDYTKKNFNLGLSKLCNGVLRSLIRLEDLPMQLGYFESEDEFYSIPKWIYDLWLRSYGHNDTIKLLTRSLQRPKNCIRLNKLHEDYIKLKNYFDELPGAEPLGFDGFVFNGVQLPKEILNKTVYQLHIDGAFSWQASGSQVVLEKCFTAVPELLSQVWWDACAGQGGKTFALLEQGVHINLVSDLSLPRLKQLQFTAKRLGHSLPQSVIMSAAKPDFNLYDGSVLLDVPCTGLGTLAKRPDIRIHRSYDDLQEMLKTQQEILNGAWAVLKPNRFLIYMTCTVNPLENEVQVESFLQNHSNAKLLYSWQTPHEHPWLEGMYVAVLQKN